MRDRCCRSFAVLSGRETASFASSSTPIHSGFFSTLACSSESAHSSSSCPPFGHSCWTATRTRSSSSRSTMTNSSSHSRHARIDTPSSAFGAHQTASPHSSRAQNRVDCRSSLSSRAPWTAAAVAPCLECQRPWLSEVRNSQNLHSCHPSHSPLFVSLWVALVVVVRRFASSASPLHFDDRCYHPASVVWVEALSRWYLMARWQCPL